MLKTDPDALKTFDEVYKTQVLESGELHENMLQWDTATVKAILDKKVYFPPELNSLIIRSSGCRVNRTADTPRTKL